MSQIKGEELEDHRQSTYRQVMQNDAARHAYLNTTQGILFGNPEQEGVAEIIEDLTNGPVAFFFTADPTLPRPVFHTRDVIYVGAEEIALAISKLSKHTSP